MAEVQRRRPMQPPPPRGPPGPVQPKAATRSEPVDREKTCPLLLRVFTKIGGHHTESDFAVRGKEPKDEVQIYTWMDANLRELTDLVKEVAPEARKRDAMLSFAFVYPDKNGKFVVREVGKTYSIPSGRRPDSGNQTLSDLKFEIGDYLDVAVYFNDLMRK
ncbi:PREDICTED: histone deacetylase complex subunit SAP18 [Ipomoea nil]|uniref:histone deacetylase complex subunit SAP18 n=1 Tax=Ipomoea nil TaxID=35883 RepID=UPI000901E0FB|nr:PREDICTED: histone deacetylase complex subunit SAP18 [Ipomoea nil]